MVVAVPWHCVPVPYASQSTTQRQCLSRQQLRSNWGFITFLFFISFEKLERRRHWQPANSLYLVIFYYLASLTDGEGFFFFFFFFFWLIHAFSNYFLNSKFDLKVLCLRAWGTKKELDCLDFRCHRLKTDRYLSMMFFTWLICQVDWWIDILYIFVWQRSLDSFLLVMSDPVHWSIIQVILSVSPNWSQSSLAAIEYCILSSIVLSHQGHQNIKVF